MQKITTPADDPVRSAVFELESVVDGLERSARGLLFLTTVNDEGLLHDGKLSPDLYADALSSSAERIESLIQDLRTRYDAVFDLVVKGKAPAPASAG